MIDSVMIGSICACAKIRSHRFIPRVRWGFAGDGDGDGDGDSTTLPVRGYVVLMIVFANKQHTVPGTYRTYE